MTQTELQTGATSSASTLVHSEEQVCKYCVKIVTFRLKRLVESYYSMLAVSKGKLLANDHMKYIFNRALENSIAMRML